MYPLHLFFLFLLFYFGNTQASYSADREEYKHRYSQGDIIPRFNLVSSLILEDVGTVRWSSPAAADLNKDGIIDAVVGTASGYVVAVSSNGQLLWKKRIPGAECAKSTNIDRLYSSPKIGSLRNDGTLQVVIGYGGFNGKSCDGGVIALNGADGSIAWKFSVRDWGKKNKVWNYLNSVIATPALVKLRSGQLAIAFGSFNRHFFLLNPNGKIRWVYNVADTVWSSAAPLNIDGDADEEFVVGIDTSRSASGISKNGGAIVLFDTKPVNGIISFGDKKRKVIRGFNPVEQVIYSTPVVGDFIPRNQGLEIAVGSGCYFPDNSNDKLGKWFKVLAAKTAKTLFTLPVYSCTASSASIGDFDSDGIKDLLISSSGSKSVGGKGSPDMYLYTFKNGFPEILHSSPSNTDPFFASGGRQFQSPAILEGEIPLLVNQELSLYLRIPNSNSSSLKHLEFAGSISFKADEMNNPFFIDLNSDNKLDAVIVRNDNNRASFHFALQEWKVIE